MNTLHTFTAIAAQPTAQDTDRPANQPAGSWHLGHGHALRLRGQQAAVLRIKAGRVWATLDGPHSGPANNQGDLVLAAGEELCLRPGQGVVIEPWGAPAHQGQAQSQLESDVFFSWDPLPAQVAAQPNAKHIAQSAPRSRLQVAVGDPLRELGLALWQVARALAHLATGVAGLGEFLVAGRGRVLPCMESNPP